MHLYDRVRQWTLPTLAFITSIVAWLFSGAPLFLQVVGIAASLTLLYTESARRLLAAGSAWLHDRGV